MDFPKGGSGAMMDALARGVTKHPGCSVEVSSEAEEILIEDGRATGVRLKKSGKILRAKEAVVSNADLYHTFRLVKEGANAEFDEERHKFFAGSKPSEGSVPFCKSFMHLHLGVRADLIPDDAPPAVDGRPRLVPRNRRPRKRRGGVGPVQTRPLPRPGGTPRDPRLHGRKRTLRGLGTVRGEARGRSGGEREGS